MCVPQTACFHFVSKPDKIMGRSRERSMKSMRRQQPKVNLTTHSSPVTLPIVQTVFFFWAGAVFSYFFSSFFGHSLSIFLYRAHFLSLTLSLSTLNLKRLNHPEKKDMLVKQSCRINCEYDRSRTTCCLGWDILCV